MVNFLLRQSSYSRQVYQIITFLIFKLYTLVYQLYLSKLGEYSKMVNFIFVNFL